MTLVEFLRARIAEDEAAVREEIEHDADHDLTRWGSTRVLAECEAKRQVVESRYSDPEAHNTEYRLGWNASTDMACRFLALPYADHPDYRAEEWSP